MENGSNCATLKDLLGFLPDLVVTAIVTGGPVVVFVAILVYMFFGKEREGVQKLLLLFVLAVFMLLSAVSMLNLAYGMEQKLCPGWLFFLFVL